MQYHGQFAGHGDDVPVFAGEALADGPSDSATAACNDDNLLSHDMTFPPRPLRANGRYQPSTELQL